MRYKLFKLIDNVMYSVRVPKTAASPDYITDKYVYALTQKDFDDYKKLYTLVEIEPSKWIWQEKSNIYERVMFLDTSHIYFNIDLAWQFVPSEILKDIARQIAGDQSTPDEL